MLRAGACLRAPPALPRAGCRGWLQGRWVRSAGDGRPRQPPRRERRRRPGPRGAPLCAGLGPGRRLWAASAPGGPSAEGQQVRGECRSHTHMQTLSAAEPREQLWRQQRLQRLASGPAAQRRRADAGASLRPIRAQCGPPFFPARTFHPPSPWSAIWRVCLPRCARPAAARRRGAPPPTCKIQPPGGIKRFTATKTGNSQTESVCGSSGARANAVLALAAAARPAGPAVRGGQAGSAAAAGRGAAAPCSPCAALTC
jgi:hypothetical protein